MRNVAKKGLLTAVATGSVLASTAGYAYASAEAHGGAVNSPGVGSGNSVQVPVDVPINACGNTVDVIGLLNPSYGNKCANIDSGTHAGSGTHSGSGNHGDSGTRGDAGAPGHAAPGGAGQAAGQGTTGEAPRTPASDGWSSGDTHPDTTAYGASASGVTAGSPGVLSGNNASAPVNIPVNACGNSVDVVGAANPAFGNSCGNEAVVTPPPATPEEECPPEEVESTHTPEIPGTPRAGGPAEAPPAVVAAVAPAVVPAAAVVPAQTVTSPQLASTGAGGVEMLGAAGLAAMLGGGVLYRRARAGVR